MNVLIWIIVWLIAIANLFAALVFRIDESKKQEDSADKTKSEDKND